MTTTRPDYDTITAELRATLRLGARPTTLMRHHRGLVDALHPAGPDAATAADRALSTATLVSEAVRSLDTPLDAVMAVLLGIAPGTAGKTLTDRRASAAGLLGIQPATFRADRHEAAYVAELALEIYRRASSSTG